MNQLITLNKQVSFFPSFLWVMDEGITHHFSETYANHVHLFLTLKPFFFFLNLQDLRETCRYTVIYKNNLTMSLLPSFKTVTIPQHR